MKKLIIIIVIAISFSSISAQTVLMEEIVNQDTIQKIWGKNLRHFGHFYSNFGFIAGPSEEGSEINYLSSAGFAFGYRYKFKVCNYYAIGADMNFSFMSYRLKQEDSKLLPDNLQHEKEILLYNRIKTEVYQRINFGRRGNYIGKYFDVGVFGSYNFATSHFYKDDFSDQQYNHEIQEVTNKKLKYIEDISYGLISRVGLDRWVIFAEYRISDLFKTYELQPDKYPELPRLMVGVEISFF